MASRLARLVPALLAAVLAACFGRSAGGAVVVLANRTGAKAAVHVGSPGAAPRRIELEADAVLPVPVVGEADLWFDSGGDAKRYRLRPYTAFALAARDGVPELFEVRVPPVPGEAPPAEDPGVPAAPEDDPRRHALLKVPLMVLVDDDEPAVRAVWERRLRRRVEEASAVFERACRVRFEVAAVGTWESDDAVRDFTESFREFERKVRPAPARLAVGFSSQYEVIASHERLGGTRGPLHPYILVREWSPHVGEPQRLEVLVHELGHFLGAVHAADPGSVMRPALTDRRSNARDFLIRFDPLNALVLYEVADELRTRPVRSLGELSGPAKERLRALYAALDQGLPADQTARLCAALLDHPAGALSGDRLTEHSVRAAAKAAADLPGDVAGRALLLGLGIGLDDSDALRGSKVFGPMCRRVETDDERAGRLRALRQPTVAGRRDLAQHFFVSCALAALAGPAGAEAAGLVKEVLDARRGSGFSFADLAADLAGVEFARRVAAGKLTPGALATSFAVADHVPSVSGLKEGIALGEFLTAYGAGQGEQFQREVAAIRARIAALPGNRDAP